MNVNKNYTFKITHLMKYTFKTTHPMKSISSHHLQQYMNKHIVN